MKTHEILPFTDAALRVQNSESGEKFYVATCQSDDVLAKVYNDNSANPFHHGLANARLYAASPDLFKGVEAALFDAFLSEDDAKFAPLYRAYFKALRGDYPDLDTSEFLRTDYFLMLCGSIESSRWPERRQVTAKEFEEFGVWRSAYEMPIANNWYLVQGEYMDEDGDLHTSAILPSFYADHESGFDVTVGAFTQLHLWMEMPQLEDVFQSALWREMKYGSAENEEEDENDGR